MTPAPTAWVTNDSVDAIAQRGDHTFIGGSFDRMGPATGALGLYDPATGDPATTPVPVVIGGAVRASVGDGAGGYYIAGQFTHVAGVARPKVAHITADGTLDPNFDPPAPNGDVDAIARAPDGTVYVGGTFDNVGTPPTARPGMAAYAPDGTLVAGFDPALGNDPEVNDLAPAAGGDVYVGGSFTTTGTVRTSLARLNPNGTVDGDFSADVTIDFGDPIPGTVEALLLDGGALYVGGVFTHVAGTSRDCIAKVGASTGALQDWLAAGTEGNGVDDIVKSANNKIFAAGHFSQMGGQTRDSIAAIDPGGTGAVLAGQAPTPESSGNLRLAAVGNQVFVGGGEISGSLNRLYSFTTDTLSLSQSFVEGPDGDVDTILPFEDGLLVGGSMRSYKSIPKRHLAELDANGVPTDFDAGIANQSSEPEVNAIVVGPQRNVYVGGQFDEAGGAPRRRVAGYDPDGDLLSFDPSVGDTGGFPENSVDALALSPDGERLFVGGFFGEVNGDSRSDLAAVDPESGATIDAFANPGIGGGSFSVVAALSADSAGGVYAGGFFEEVNGNPSPPIARFDASGVKVATFAPPSGTSNSVTGLHRAGGRLYVSGEFENLGATGTHNVAALDPTTGAAADDFKPNVTGFIQAITASADGVFIGGEVDSVNGVDRQGIALLSPTGQLAPYNPDLEFAGALVAPEAGDLLVGGFFDHVGTSPAAGYAQFITPGHPSNPPPGGGGGGGPPVTPSKDVTPPVLSRLSLTSKRPRTGKSTTLRLTLSEAARVSVRVERALAGRKVGRSCKKPSRKLAKRRRCTRWVRARSASKTLPAGRGSIKISTKRLKPGRYRLAVSARDVAGNATKKPRLVSFTVLKAAKKKRR
jgi:hypothetical protein